LVTKTCTPIQEIVNLKHKKADLKPFRLLVMDENTRLIGGLRRIII